MKHTKKMIMVPEAEYMTLLNMIKGDNYLKAEKAETETKMSNVLRDPKLSEGAKARKYSWLLKQRRQLKKEVEKPQTIQIDPEQLQNLQSDISKYLGIAATQPKVPASPLLTTPQSKKKTKKKPQKTPPTQTQKQTQQPTTSAQHTTSTKPTTSEEHLFSEDEQMYDEKKPEYIIHPNYYNDMIKIIKNNSTKLNIDKKTGQIIDDLLDTPIRNSNYTHTVGYLTGKITQKPPGTDELIDRMKNEKYYKDALKWAEQHRQAGTGKYRLKLPTKGLIRVKQHQKRQKFKPQIWERL